MPSRAGSYSRHESDETLVNHVFTKLAVNRSISLYFAKMRNGYSYVNGSRWFFGSNSLSSCFLKCKISRIHKIYDQS